jgi:AcrR family transcriptional regulator
VSTCRGALGEQCVPRVKQRTPELRARLVDAGVDLLGAEGAGALTARALAERAGTSPPAIYELFGDKAGVVRALYLEGFRRLAAGIRAQGASSDPMAGLWALVGEYRRFVRASPGLAEVMFARPPGAGGTHQEESAATGSVRLLVAERVRRCVEDGTVYGDATDVAHVLVVLLEGMSLAEVAGRLGTDTESVERRWRLAVAALLNGLRPPGLCTETTACTKAG